jgi:hypothetical protein
MAKSFSLWMLASVAAFFVADSLQAATYIADPDVTSGSSYYRKIIKQLKPGDTLMLPAGTYRGRLNLNGLQGRVDAWITITGPDSGPPAIITTDSDCCNNVQLGNTWFVALKNLTIDANNDSINASVDGINAKGGITHDILVENCIIKGVSHKQGTTGISTKSMAWNWIIRRNTILEAGTGAYLGNSNGSAPFIGGIIDGNLFVDSIGYNMQIKYQKPYSSPSGLPPGVQKTIIRNNVFLKRLPQSSVPSDKLSGPRPNLLVGGFPDSGDGSMDMYEIYGNFFYQNRDKEALIQASGRVSIHDNIFVDGSSTAIVLQNHDLPLKLAHVYNNTIYSGSGGIRFRNRALIESIVTGNLVFSSTPIAGIIGKQSGNITDSTGNAAKYVKNPSTILGSMDFYPLPGQCTGSPLDGSSFSEQTDYNADFNGTSKGDFSFRGAYSEDGSNPGWQLDARFKKIDSGPPTGGT